MTSCDVILYKQNDGDNKSEQIFTQWCRKVGGSIADGFIGIFLDFILLAALCPWDRLRL
jgi:hypothetical protein